MTKKEEITEKALELVEEYFGSYTKTLYTKFYEDKDVKTIFASIEELLTETIGPKKTKTVLTPLAKKYHLTMQDDQA